MPDLDNTVSIRREVHRKLILIAREEREPRIVLDKYEIAIDVADFVDHLLRFSHQAIFYLQERILWPCVLVDKTDIIDGIISPRFIPFDIEDVDRRPMADRNALIQEAISEGVPVSPRPVAAARDGFIEGTIDAILGRARSMMFGSRNPEVEITTSPAGDTIMFSEGHFFASTGRGFGTSDCKKRIAAKTYCFYRSTEIPNTGMTLWTITADTSIKL
jgi:hypothetical protein